LSGCCNQANAPAATCGDRGAAPFDAGDRDLAVMQLDQTLRDREAEAGALGFLHPRRLGLVERAEQIVQFDSGIADAWDGLRRGQRD